MERLFKPLIFAMAFATLPAVAAENYPEKAIRFVVPFPPGGGTDGLARTLGEKLTEMFTVPFPTVPHVKTGRLRPVTLLGKKRIEAMPNVPTAIEAGYPELGDVIEWYGVAVPAATPREKIVKLNGAIVRALNSPDVLKRIDALGQYPAPSTPDAFKELIRQDFVRWGKVVKASGAKLN